MPLRKSEYSTTLNLFFSLRLISASLRRCQDEKLSEINLTSPQYAMLLTINQLKEPVSQKEIANQLEQSQNSVSLIVERMRKNGLIEANRDLPDRRAIRLSLTPKGSRSLKQAHLVAKNLVQKVFNCLSNEEIVQLQCLLDKVRAETFNIRELPADVKTFYMEEARVK